MILLLGGTSETAPIARGLARAGYQVLASKATNIVQKNDVEPNITQRIGMLDKASMMQLIREKNINAVVDCTHPYALKVRQTARAAAAQAAIPYFTIIRPEIVAENEEIIFAADHAEAAVIACASGRPVLLTTGSKNLAPYIRESRKQNVRLVVRVLPEAESISACTTAGIQPDCIITGRGPFSLEENRQVIKKYKIGVLVTKDSGKAGGVEEKLRAAHLEGCRVIVVRRVKQPTKNVFADTEKLLAAVMAEVEKE